MTYKITCLLVFVIIYALGGSQYTLESLVCRIPDVVPYFKTILFMGWTGNIALGIILKCIVVYKAYT